MSLRALARLLHEPSGDPGEAWEPVLANILDAELNQLAVLVGDITAALRMETDATGPVRRLDLSRALEAAARRTGSRVLVDIGQAVHVAAHPEIVAQAIASALSLALRVAEGRVIAASLKNGTHGAVTVSVPVSDDVESWHRFDGRVTLLKRIVGAEGGRVSMEHRPGTIAVRLSFPLARREEKLA